MNGAHVHLALNHIPVLGSFLTLILLVIVLVMKNQYVFRWSCAWMIFLGLATIPTYLSGDPAEDIVEQVAGESVEPFIEAHEDFAVYSLWTTEVLAVLAIWGLFQSWRRKDESANPVLKLMIAVSVLNIVLMMITSNLGGQIRHPEIRAGFQTPDTSEAK